MPIHLDFVQTCLPLLAVGSSAAQTLITGITIFVLAVFVGFEIITKIPPTLHTPLMSGSNAISGITIVGAIIASGQGYSGGASFLGFVALIMATINVVGGFLVTNRMLEMFRKKKKK
jgi:NAD(P) transhydrogenase subunit alpha